MDGRLQAIEYVSSKLVYSGKTENRNPISNVQAIHSDGFSLVWGTNRHDPRQCSITIQFNFLSTDFSNAKGVHGVTMQLCSKTEEVSTNPLGFPSTDPRISYCRIQLFRSHGAERKMANDIASAEKRIERLGKQLCQSQARAVLESKKLGKQKRNHPEVFAKPRRLQKVHEEGLRSRVVSLQRICRPTQSYSFLDQPGQKQQHFDWYPKTGELLHQEASVFSTTISLSDDGGASMPPILRHKDPISSSNPIGHTPPPLADGSRQETPTLTGPLAIRNKPVQRGDDRVACFYIRSIDGDRYAPIYLIERTACELTRRIAAAMSVEPASVVRLVWLCDNGLKIIVDDDVVLNMKECQGMRIALRNVGAKLHSETRCEVNNDVQKLLEFELEF